MKVDAGLWTASVRLSTMPYPERLHHAVPGWVEDGALFHIRIRSEKQESLVGMDGAVARTIIDAARHYHECRRWFCRLLLVMPDHLHAMAAFPRDAKMNAVVGAWKSYLSKTHGIGWQRGFFDHRLRSRKESDECWRYIRQNPVQAGLVKEPEEWIYIWSPPDTVTPA